MSVTNQTSDLHPNDLTELDELFNTVVIEEEEFEENIDPDYDIQRYITAINSSEFEFPEAIQLEADLDCINEETFLRLNMTDQLRAAIHPNIKTLAKEKYGMVGIAIKKQFCLKPYQEDGVRRMKNSENRSFHGMRGSLLHADQGVGKSLQAIVLALSTPVKNGIKTPTIIVCSKTMLNEWKVACIEKFLVKGTVKVLYFHSDFSDVKNVTVEYLEQFDIIITTTDVVGGGYANYPKMQDEIQVMGDEHTLMNGKVDYVQKRSRTQCLHPASRQQVRGAMCLFHIAFQRIILDESQCVSNPSTRLFKAMMALYGEAVHCLSGTPMVNGSKDLFTQFRLMGYNGMMRATDWKRRFMAEDAQYRLLATISIRQEKDKLNIVLTKLIRNVIHVQLSAQETVFYESLKQSMKDAFSQFLAKKLNFAHVLALFTRLRQCVDAANLCLPKVQSAEDHDEFADDIVNKNPMTTWLVDLESEAGINSAKILALVDLIRTFPRDEKVLIFSSFIGAQALILRALGRAFPESIGLQIDGSTKRRDVVLNQFREQPSSRFLVITLKIGSTGLNITEATRIVIFDPWYNSATHNQAFARSHRIGQNSDVYCYFMIAPGTIEDRILEICQEKDVEIDNTMKGSRGGGGGLDADTMRRILGM